MLTWEELRAQAEEVAKGIGDYKTADFVAQLDEFVHRWREANPAR